MRKNSRKKLNKICCEIEGCGIKDPNLLDLHHIIERTEVNTSNHDMNLAVLCSVHHRMIHAGKLQIIGVFPSTKPPGRILAYILEGKANIEGLTQGIFQPKNQQMRIRNEDKK